MRIRLSALIPAALGAVFFLSAGAQPDAQLSFARGDIVVSLEHGPVQWWRADGTLVRTLVGREVGTGEGMAFDAAGNLYVARWCFGMCLGGGNSVEVFSSEGVSVGNFGSGYDCSPRTIVFDGPGTAYVSQAGCTGAILKFVPGRPPVSYNVAWDFQGSFWIDLAPDRCTMFYTSYGPNVKRYDVCADVQLPDFNVAPVPGGLAHDLRVLPDGGVIVATGEVISRLDAHGVLTRTYSVPDEPSYWAGVEVVNGDTLWAANYESSRVHRFDLTTGDRTATLDANTPRHTVVAVRVKQ